MTQKKKSLKKIIKLANECLNPDTSTVEGLKTYLKTWYVLKFNVPFKDPVLLSHSLEELLVLYYVHAIKDNPSIAEEVLESDVQSYEEWLQQQMGEDYVSEEEMVNNMVEYTNKEQEIAKDLPDDLSLDLSNLGEE